MNRKRIEIQKVIDEESCSENSAIYDSDSEIIKEADIENCTSLF